ncbi:hypothetical protein SEA_TIMINATOR_44 [Arthrobacter phage Timinator]|uniref:Uncharacterized protein n=2 Tax=Marthavirus barretlemon TaxID=2560300 RepID=A0A386KLJ5_9CAUD|nr:hypothetical protein SEA_TIMINATOR_44 [Arthrobacter phage Timinator]AYD86515.1 hypothetical protein SEA_LEEROYJ_44 [Arthrobacter phage LeeroyJ]
MTATVREQYVAYCPDCNEGNREPEEFYDDVEKWADEHNREFHESDAAEQEIADEMTRNSHK